MDTRTLLATGLGTVAICAATGCGGASDAGGLGEASPGVLAKAAPTEDAAPADGVSEALIAIEEERLELLVDADTAAAAPLHADDFELIPPPGYPMTRDEYLAAVEAGELDYHVFEPISEIEVRVDGASAVLWYESRIDIDAAGVGRVAHDAWHLYYYENHDGQWQVVREQATAVGGFPPAG